MTTEIGTHPAVTPPVMRRIVWSSIIGTAVEWYDFLIYATATALVFNHLFFPSNNPSISAIAAFGTYAVGFLARPLGAVIFGHLGDKIGRKTTLVSTIIIMGMGTFLIGVLPTYQQIGIAAPILLVVLRILQGIGLGGEWGGAVLMVVESAPVKRRGLLGSAVQVGNPIGNLVAIAIFAVLSRLPDSDFLGWAWRIPFLLSIALIGVGLFIRLRLEETPAFRQLKEERAVARAPIVEIFRYHRRSFFIAVGLKIAEISYASIAGVFVISYATGHLGLPRTTILNAVMLSSIIALFSIPLFGWLSDKLGRKFMFYAGSLFCAAFAFPMFALLDTADPAIVSLTVIVAISGGQMVMFGVGAPWYAELFTARLRYTGASLGFQVGAALSGGLTPLIAVALLSWSGGATWPVSVFLISCALITAFATFKAPETARQELV